MNEFESNEETWQPDNHKIMTMVTKKKMKKNEITRTKRGWDWNYNDYAKRNVVGDGDGGGGGGCVC